MDIAKLAFEDGTVYTGKAFGARGESDGEVVFNTSMTGYQEILTDPSYHGQIVAMTYPQIGNYGVNAQDAESRRPWVRGFVVRELSGRVSSYRAGGSLAAYLEEHGVIGIEGIDTRTRPAHAGTGRHEGDPLDDRSRRCELDREGPGQPGPRGPRPGSRSDAQGNELMGARSRPLVSLAGDGRRTPGRRRDRFRCAIRLVPAACRRTRFRDEVEHSAPPCRYRL